MAHVTVTAKHHKADDARAIFNQHFGVKTRKEIVTLFQTEANLTENGAKTYYQTFKKKAEQQAAVTAKLNADIDGE